MDPSSLGPSSSHHLGQGAPASSTHAPQEAQERRAGTSGLESLPAVLHRKIGDEGLSFPERVHVVQTSKALRAGFESGSADPLIAELYAAKAAHPCDPARLQRAQRLIRHRAQREWQAREAAEELNARIANLGQTTDRADFHTLFDLTRALAYRGSLNDAYRVQEIWFQRVESELDLWKMAQLCLEIAVECCDMINAVRWFAAAAKGAELALMFPSARLDDVVARALLLRHDFDEALARRDPNLPVDVRRIVTDILDARIQGADGHEVPDLLVGDPPEGMDRPVDLALFAEFAQHVRQLRKFSMQLDPADWPPRILRSPMMKLFRDSPEGRLILNAEFMLPEQLSTIPIRFDWERLPAWKPPLYHVEL